MTKSQYCTKTVSPVVAFHSDVLIYRIFGGYVSDIKDYNYTTCYRNNAHCQTP